MGKVKALDKVTEFLEDVLARRPEVLLLAFREKREPNADSWTTARAYTTDLMPYAEMLGIIEVLKSRILDEYYSDGVIGPHQTLRRDDDEGEER